MRSLACILFLFCFCIATASAQNYARYSDIKANMVDRHVEHQAVMAANKRAATLRCKESYEDAKIVSDDWDKIYSEAGRLIGRAIHMELYGTNYEGKCGVSHCIFQQKMRGDDTYSPKLTLVELGPFYNLKCE
jgi:hypothetical protein